MSPSNDETDMPHGHRGHVLVGGAASSGVVSGYLLNELTGSLLVRTEPPGAAIAVATAAGARISVRNLGAAALGETMLLFAAQREGAAGKPSARLAEAALTPRETEVLSWLAKGKTNRDIGEILGTSPRTVNKHLEHIFEKLGVETRAAAAALASGQLA